MLLCLHTDRQTDIDRQTARQTHTHRWIDRHTSLTDNALLVFLMCRCKPKTQVWVFLFCLQQVPSLEVHDGVVYLEHIWPSLWKLRVNADPEPYKRMKPNLFTCTSILLPPVPFPCDTHSQVCVRSCLPESDVGWLRGFIQPFTHVCAHH